MREKLVENLKAQSEIVERRLDSMLKSLSTFSDAEGRAYNLSAIIPSTDSSVSDVRARHASIASLVRKLDRKGGNLVPVALFNSALNSLRAITNAADQIESQLDLFKTWGGLQTFSYDNFQATARNGNQADLSSVFKTFFDSSEAYLEDFQNLFQSINPSRAAFNFSSATEALSAALSKASEDRNELAQILKRAKASLHDIDEKRSALATTTETAAAEAANVSKQLGEASEATGQIEAHRQRANEIIEAASELEKNVSGFGKQFDDFDKKLRDRLEKLENGNDSLDILVSEFNSQKEYIQAIIEQSDSMLSSATVAGLSSEFKSIRDDLSNQLKSAQCQFYISLLLLTALSVPLMIYIFSPIIAPFITDDKNLISAIAATGTEKSGWQYVGGVISRFIVLLPGVWFVTFASKRYNSLFSLREHYSYKYSMAVAVDGFKKQARGYEDLIAALVFEQLAFNPADRLSKLSQDEKSEEDSIQKLLVDFLRKRGAE